MKSYWLPIERLYRRLLRWRWRHVLAIVKALDPELPVHLEDSEFNTRGSRCLVRIKRTAKTEGPTVQDTVLFHIAKSLSCRRPTTIEIATLNEDVGLQPVHLSSDRMRDKVALVPFLAVTLTVGA